MLVDEKTQVHTSIIGSNNTLNLCMSKVRRRIDMLPLMLYNNRENTIFSSSFYPNSISKNILKLRPDLIHLHWVTNGFLRIETLNRLRRPLVWTLHDMWPFTGGCHYSGECDKYEDSCGKCPMLGSSINKDLSRWNWNRKKKSWDNLNLTIITPSNWLANCAKTSSLFGNYRIEVIPNGLNLDVFKPIEKNSALEKLSLPQNKKYILIGSINIAKDKRKGANFFKCIFQELFTDISEENRPEFIIFGASESSDLLDFGLKSHFMGFIDNDKNLVTIYSAADVYAFPSTQDNLPNTVMESMACGTPVVAFDIGGISDMIEHKKNGYLVEPFDTEDFSNGIKWAISDERRLQSISCQARKKVEREFAIENVALRHSELYSEILNTSRL